MASIEFWIVTIASDCAIDDVADRLRREGLSVRELLKEVGCITGEADSATAERIKRLEGVVDIAPDTPIDIGPPGADKTW